MTSGGVVLIVGANYTSVQPVTTVGLSRGHPARTRHPDRVGQPGGPADHGRVSRQQLHLLSRDGVDAHSAPVEALRTDPGRPLLTMYDDFPTPGSERIELSVTTFDNWVSKTANFLLDELMLEPGEPVAVTAAGALADGRHRGRRARRPAVS